MRIALDDIVPRLHDAGLDAAINSIIDTAISGSTLSADFETFVGIVNNAVAYYVNGSMLLKYLTDRRGAGEFRSLVLYGGSWPGVTLRPDALTGVGQDANSIGFTTPDDGEHTIRWYVDGVFTLEREQDCMTQLGRSATKAELGCIAGDVVQACVVENGVVGWWTRLTVT